MLTHEEALEELKAAVVRQACYDYLSFLKKPDKKIHYDTKNGKWKYETEKSLTRWFLSEDFKVWCKGADGETVMKQLRKNFANGFRLFTDEMSA